MEISGQVVRRGRSGLGCCLSTPGTSVWNNSPPNIIGGYSTKREGGSVEYRVSHVPWRVWTVSETRFEGDGDLLYGDEFGECLNRAPDSAFIAEGPEIRVQKPRRLPV
jgi:hypothetical protein